MKKIIFGFILGLSISIPLVTFAEATQQIENYIGRQIEGQFPVIINGIKLEKPGLVIDGTTFVPIRLISEVLGAEISFIDSEVIMRTDSVIPTPTPTQNLNQNEKSANSGERNLEQINYLKSEIDRMNSLISDYQSANSFNEQEIEKLKNSPNASDKESVIKIREFSIQQNNNAIEVLEEKIANLQAQLAELEAQ